MTLTNQPGRLRDDLERASFGVAWGFLGDFALGAPLWPKNRRRVFLDLYDSVRRTVDLENRGRGFSDEELDWLSCDRMVAVMVEVLNRATEKSIGLLQALAILAAVITIMMPVPYFVGYVALGSTLLAALLIFANIGLTWRRQNNFFMTPRVRLKELYGLVLVRSHRLRLVQAMAFICFLLTFGVTLVRALSELKIDWVSQVLSLIAF